MCNSDGYVGQVRKGSKLCYIISKKLENKLHKEFPKIEIQLVLAFWEITQDIITIAPTFMLFPPVEKASGGGSFAVWMI